MRMMTWNIYQGGGSRTAAICDHLERLTARQRPGKAPPVSTLVLTEFRSGKTGRRIRSKLTDCGLLHQAAAPTSHHTQNSLLIASSQPFEVETFPALGADSHRCVRANFEDLTLYGLYFAQGRDKIPLFDFLAGLGAQRLRENTLLIGDFNTGRNGPDNEGSRFVASERLERLLEKGWVDVWRSRHPDAREYSWYTKRAGQPLNGFRIDLALASPALDSRIANASYEHEPRLVEPRLSDHSALVLDLDRL